MNKKTNTQKASGSFRLYALFTTSIIVVAIMHYIYYIKILSAVDTLTLGIILLTLIFMVASSLLAYYIFASMVCVIFGYDDYGTGRKNCLYRLLKLFKAGAERDRYFWYSVIIRSGTLIISVLLFWYIWNVSKLWYIIFPLILLSVLQNLFVESSPLKLRQMDWERKTAGSNEIKKNADH